MAFLLLDTDVFSFLLRPGDTRALLYQPHVRDKDIVLSFITVGELYAWVEKRRWGGRTTALIEDRIASAVVLPFDRDLCRVYGRLKAALPAGRVMPPNDLWIAACAVRHDIPLATHNRRHFEAISGLRIICES